MLAFVLPRVLCPVLCTPEPRTSKRVSSSFKPLRLVLLSTPASSITCCFVGLGSLMTSSSLASAAPEKPPRLSNAAADACAGDRALSSYGSAATDADRWEEVFPHRSMHVCKGKYM